MFRPLARGKSSVLGLDAAENGKSRNESIDRKAPYTYICTLGDHAMLILKFSVKTFQSMKDNMSDMSFTKILRE